MRAGERAERGSGATSPKAVKAAPALERAWRRGAPPLRPDPLRVSPLVLSLLVVVATTLGLALLFPVPGWVPTCEDTAGEPQIYLSFERGPRLLEPRAADPAPRIASCDGYEAPVIGCPSIPWGELEAERQRQRQRSSVIAPPPRAGCSDRCLHTQERCALCQPVATGRPLRHEGCPKSLPTLAGHVERLGGGAR